MQKIVLFLSTIIFFIVTVHSCKSQVKENAAYPSLADQRASLTAKGIVTPSRLLDSGQIISDLEYFASDVCEGRRTGTPGHTKATERIIWRMRSAGIDSFNNSLIQNFKGGNVNGTDEGTNIIGWVKGTKYPGKYIVITAHYDHLGKKGAATFYGADDNASGAACLLSLAKYFKQNPHECSLIFAALDREETGLEGAYHLIPHLTKNLQAESLQFNLNMDMIARSDKNEIFACGIKHYPTLKYLVDSVQNKTNVKLLMGHDEGEVKDDWTYQSDHYAFHKKDIPFLYIGVEDHPDYHKASDTYNKINYSNYLENCNMIALILQTVKL